MTQPSDIWAKIAEDCRKSHVRIFRAWFCRALGPATNKHGLLVRYHLLDLDPAHRMKVIRDLLVLDRQRLREDKEFLIPCHRWSLAGLLVAEGRALRRTRKIAERFQPMREAAE